MRPPIRKRPLFPMRSNVIAVDVDGTLGVQGVLNERLITWCREQKAAGKTLILWSARGEAHARRAAEFFGVSDVFDVIMGKPEAIVDDKGWGWIRFTRVIRSFEPHE